MESLGLLFVDFGLKFTIFPLKSVVNWATFSLVFLPIGTF